MWRALEGHASGTWMETNTSTGPAGIGAILLGYCDPVVDEAVREQISHGVNFSVNHELEIELAEELVRTIPCAEIRPPRPKTTRAGTETTRREAQARHQKVKKPPEKRMFPGGTQKGLMVATGLEPVTSTMSTWRSNQLS